MASTVALPDTLEEAHEQILSLRSENERLKFQLDRYARKTYGKSSEQLTPDQLLLAFMELKKQENTNESDAGDEEEVEVKGHKRKRRRRGRTKFSEDLPRERVVIEPDSTDCGCCKNPMKRIGEETSEQIHHEPATLTVIETVRPKYACPTCKNGVRCAPPPKTAIPKSKATASTLAHVAVSKYVDHLPLVRQVSMFERQGVFLSKQTLCGWIRQISDMLKPVDREAWASVQSSSVLMADETTVKLQAPEKCKTSHLWAYLGDKNEIVFDFSKSRGAQVPIQALSRFTSGTLVCDGYAGYNEFLRIHPDVIGASCWAHARRKFFEAKTTERKYALLVLGLISKLYRVESRAAQLADDHSAHGAKRHALTLAARQEQSLKILDRLRGVLDAPPTHILPKSPMGAAINYARNQWAGLCRFAHDGAVPIDNNAVERRIRAVAIGRRNWTFCGSEAGGEWAARLYGLLGTCKMQGINPHEWLSDVLLRVRDQPATEMAELTPRRWAAARHGEPTSRGSPGAG